MRKLIREETTTVVKVYETDEDEVALEGAAEGVEVAEAAVVAATTSPAAEPVLESAAPALEGHDDEQGESEHSESMHVTLDDRDCYCPKPGARVRRR